MRILELTQRSDELHAICTGIPYCFASRAVSWLTEMTQNPVLARDGNARQHARTSPRRSVTARSGRRFARIRSNEGVSPSGQLGPGTSGGSSYSVLLRCRGFPAAAALSMGAYGGDDAPALVFTETALLAAMKYTFILGALYMIFQFQLAYARQNGPASWG